jgi:hypothetical protein
MKTAPVAGRIGVGKTLVVIESDTASGRWMAKTEKNEAGKKTVIFFRRAGQQSFFQPLIDMFNGIKSGRATAAKHLREHGMNPSISTAEMEEKMQMIVASPNKSRRTAFALAASVSSASATTAIIKLVDASKVYQKEEMRSALKLADVALNDQGNYKKSVPPGFDVKKGIALLERFGKYQMREIGVQRAELIKLIDALTTENNRATPKVL